MSSHLSARPRLLIVSDTAMYLLEGEIYAFEPVVREIEHFAHLFSSITWIGYQYPETPPPHARRVNPEISIEYIPLKATGGPRLIHKIQVLLRAPATGLAVWKALKNSDVVHSRAPSMPAFWAMVISAFDHSRRYWHKYAGDWTSPGAPFFYALQRRILRLIPHVSVTMNGEANPKFPHCLSWLNPCISEEELEAASQFFPLKDFDAPLQICFSGQLSKTKGVIQLIEAMTMLPKGMVARLCIAGDGPLLATAQKMVKTAGLDMVEFTGNLPRRSLEKVYRESHILVLPSASEGLPKVVPEACAHGCVPIVSAIPALLPLFSGIFKDLILPENSPACIADAIIKISNDRRSLKALALECQQLSRRFTYENYVRHIRQEILREII